VQTVIESVLPVFLVIALGVGLARAGMISIEIRQGLNRLAYWVGLPAFLILKIGQAELAGGPFNAIFALMLVGMAGCFVVATVAGRLLRLPSHTQGAFVHAAYRGNLVFVALPVVIYSIQGLPQDQQAFIESRVLLAIVPMVVAYNVVSVIVLVVHQHEKGGHPFRHMLKQLATNPLILACLTGALFNVSGLRFPVFAQRTLATLGRAAFPMALLAIGAQLARTRLGSHTGWAVGASLIKVAAAPAIGYVLGHWLNVDPVELRAGLVLLATPTAVASFVLTEQLGGDAELASGAVVISTLLSMIALSIVLVLPL